MPENLKFEWIHKKKAGNLKHNTSPNEKENAQNEYIRRENKKII